MGRARGNPEEGRNSTCQLQAKILLEGREEEIEVAGRRASEGGGAKFSIRSSLNRRLKTKGEGSRSGDQVIKAALAPFDRREKKHSTDKPPMC